MVHERDAEGVVAVTVPIQLHLEFHGRIGHSRYLVREALYFGPVLSAVAQVEVEAHLGRQLEGRLFWRRSAIGVLEKATPMHGVFMLLDH